MLTYRDNKADTACNLECLEGKPPVHEFVGPVKIVLMDLPRHVYMNKMCMAGLVGLANLLIGGTVMTVLYLALAMQLPLFESLHIILCTFGYQLCIPMGILMTSNLHGPSAQMKSKDRKKHHMIIQIIGMMCAAAGSTVAFLEKEQFVMIVTPHSIIGLVACGFAVCSTLNGPIVFCSRDGTKCGRCIKGFHMFFGISTFISSSACMCVGLYFSKKFETWVPLKEMIFIPIIFCIFYTIAVVITPLKKWAKPIPDLKY